MDVTDIKTQRLGLVLDNFCICQECHIVDTDHDRSEVGHPCSKCGEPSRAGRSYFSISVYSLINLMQEFYHAKYKITDEDSIYELQDADNAKLAVIIFFTTLREVLMNNFLRQMEIAFDLPESVSKRLFSDNRTYNKKMNKLFPSLTGMKWKKAIAEINKKDNIDYQKVDRFVERVVKVRNDFLHKGIKYVIKPEMPKECIQYILPLLNLYVALHNKFVFPIYDQKIDKDL